MKQFAMAFALMCALSTSIFAGNMPTDGKVETPPPATSTTSNTLLVTVLLTILSLK